jgi:hypothetical protein
MTGSFGPYAETWYLADLLKSRGIVPFPGVPPNGLVGGTPRGGLQPKLIPVSDSHLVDHDKSDTPFTRTNPLRRFS